MIAQYEDDRKLGQQRTEIPPRHASTISTSLRAVASETAHSLKRQFD
jgi:hypothetical protein